MSGRRILIIDDEEGVRTSLQLLLEEEGYRVQTAADGAAGLERAQCETFDVVLCDVRMPGQDGLSLARRRSARDCAARTAACGSSSARAGDARCWSRRRRPCGACSSSSNGHPSTRRPC
jgi:CheY-like chemotaxis protein